MVNHLHGLVGVNGQNLLRYREISLFRDLPSYPRDHLFSTLFNQTYKDPDSRRNRGLLIGNVRGMSEYSLREKYTVNSLLGFPAWSQQTEQWHVS